MSNLLKVAMLVAALALTAASSASATTGPMMLTTNGTVGTASSTGAFSGNAASYAGPTFVVNGSTVAVRCATTTQTVTTVTTGTATVGPLLGACALTFDGSIIAPVTITSPCDWSYSFDHATFDTGTGAGTGGTFTMGCGLTFHVPALGCSLDIAAQTRPGLTLQNINTAGANDTSATPWGAKVVANVSTLTYSTTGTCPTLAPEGTGSWISTVAVRNLFGSL